MKIAIMQPYFFPYIGYWQLLNDVDEFVVYDIGKFRPRGWINRNRILIHNEPYYITIPVHRSTHILIKDMRIIEPEGFKKKSLKTIECTYGRAPFYDQCIEKLRECILYGAEGLFEYVFHSIIQICEFLDINTRFRIASEIGILNLSAEKYIIDVCKAVQADTYINAIGGMEFYSKERFAEKDIDLRFVKTNPFSYVQFNQDNFIPNLSIIDVLMFCGKEKTKALLSEYSLV